MKILDYELNMTCGACPEQYDVFHSGSKVAYFRLRHGYFSASCPGVSGELVYKSNPDGDGIFDSEEERTRELTNAIMAVEKWRSNEHS